jgi:predicted PurR-regulated permease PerM
VILWLGITGFAAWLRSLTHAPEWAARVAGFFVVIGFAGGVGIVLTQNVAEMLADLPRYEARLDELMAQLQRSLGLSGPAPTIIGLSKRIDAERLARSTANGVWGFLADATFVLLFVSFIFAAEASTPKKLDRIFPGQRQRQEARDILERVRRSMGQYLWMTTIFGVLSAVPAYVLFLCLELENALIWAILTFALSFIPTIGPILSTILPTLVALAQFDELWRVAVVGGANSLLQFVINNIVQPRVMGDSLNLSSLVVVLALALWGLVWGIAGAFLSAPLTVAIMIVLAQFGSTRWIAILLSADAEPEKAGVPPKPS